MKLIHYSKMPLAKVRSVKQQGGRDRHDKPNGLWFSVGEDEDGWRAWCEAESFGLDSLATATEIVLDPSAKILRITSADEIDAFTELHGFDCPYMPKHLSYGKGWGIRWPDVAKDHDGIMIAPYIWDRRLHDGANWYYGWDCASGVIWNAKAVNELRAIERVE